MQGWNETRGGATGEDPVARVDYQALVEDLPELVCRLTPGLVPMYVNEAYCSYFGKSREELIGRSIAQILPGEDLALLEADLASLSLENPAGVIEHRVELPDGELRWHQWTVRAVYDGEGNLTEYQVVGRDVDARRLAEEALGKSEELFRSLIESVPDIVAVFDADGTIRYDNAALERTLGSRPGERVGSSNFDYVHPEDVDLAKETFAKAVETPGTQPPVRFRVRHADGSWRNLETVRTNLLEDPSVRGIMSVARDITQRENVERELRHQKAYSDALSETAVGLTNRLETDELLNAIITRAASLVGTDHGFVNLVEPGESEMETRVGVGYFGNLVGDRLGPGVGLAGKVLQTGEPFVVEDYSTWPGRRRNVESEPVYALAGVPLGSGSRVVGVIGLAYMETERKFGAEEIGVLTRFAELATVALDNARLYESAQRELAERERTEIDLRESEELHRALFEQSVESIYVYDPDTRRILEANAAFGELIGYTSDELLEMSLYDFTAHERGEVDRSVERNVREGRSFAHGRRYRRKDGSLIEVAVSTTSIPYRGSEAVCCVARDVTERREAEEKLRRNEERFRSLVRNAPDVITVNGLDGTIHYASPAIERVLGYRPEELVGRLSYDLAHPDDLERAKEAFAEALDRPGRGVHLEAYRLRHKDGSWRWVESVRTNLLDDPAVGGMVINSRDVTGRREAEEALKESEERFRTIFDQTAVGISIADPDGKLVRTNRAYQEMLGYGEEELRGKPIAEVSHPDDLPAYTELSGEILAGRIDTYHREKRYIRKDGGVVWTRPSVSAVRDAAGGLRFLINVVEDITERKEAERALRENEERFRSLVQNASDLITVLNSEGTIRYESPSIERILGYDPEELVGEYAFDYVHPEDRDPTIGAFSDAVDGKRSELEPTEFRFHHKDGSWRRLESFGTNLLDDPNIEGVVINSRDVTERKETEDALKESEERFRAVIEQIIDGVYLGNVEDRRLIQSNAAFQQMLGYTAEELSGMEIYDFIAHPKADINAVYRVILDEGHSFIGERQYRRKDGSVVDVETSATVISYGDKEMVCTVVRDITDRKEAEKALEVSEARFRSLIRNATDLITILEADGTVRYDSPAIERVQGFRPGERIGTKAWDYVHPEDLGRAEQAFDQILKEPESQPAVEFRTRHKDGSWRRLEVIRTNLLDDPSVQGIVVNSRDVTERKEVEDQLRLRNKVVTASQNAILITDPGQPDNPIVYANPAFEAATGYSPAEVIGWNCRFLQGSDTDQPVLDEVRAALKEERECTVVLRNYKKDGTLFWNELNVYPAYDADGRLTNFVGVQNDITERKRAEKALKESEERYRAVMEQSAEAIYLHGTETKRVLESNAAFQQMLGYTAEELSGMEIYDFVAHDREDIDEKVQRNTVEETRFVGERKYRHKDGTLLDVSVSATLIPYQGGKSVCVVVRDVTQSKALEEQLRHRALHDSLTELPNRALFLDRLEHALTRFERTEEALAVLFVDLDDFKLVNDSLGHDVGNDLLVEVASRLRSCVRQEDTVARLFGDEFAVLLEAPADMDDVLRVTERIMELLQKPCDLEGQEVYANTSIGVALSDSAEDHPQDLLRRADLAMYAAKSRGKARYEIFSPSMDTRALERLEMENALRRAVENKEGFEVHYQPIVDLPSEEIVGLEALARWSRQEVGPVDTAEFIGLAESTGLIQSIGRWVLEEACQQARGWREQHPDRPPLLSVNFSASQFSRQTDLVSKILSEVGIPPEGLQLEITERSVMDNAEYSLGKLQRLKDLGVQFAIDDYGTGFSCLQYLKLMPVDSLKIDRSFVAGLGKDRGDTAIVAGTIDLAHALGLKVVAEGVETAEQLERLKELGCDMAQGFYLFRPAPAGVITELLNGSG